MIKSNILLMKIILKLSLKLILVTGVLFFSSCQENKIIEQDDIAQLLDNSVVATDSLDELSIAFKDKLKNELKDVKIIALGEARHDEGTTFKYKTKIV